MNATFDLSAEFRLLGQVETEASESTVGKEPWKLLSLAAVPPLFSNRLQINSIDVPSKSPDPKPMKKRQFARSRSRSHSRKPQTPDGTMVEGWSYPAKGGIPRQQTKISNTCPLPDRAVPQGTAPWRLNQRRDDVLGLHGFAFARGR